MSHEYISHETFSTTVLPASGLKCPVKTFVRECPSRRSFLTFGRRLRVHEIRDVSSVVSRDDIPVTFSVYVSYSPVVLAEPCQDV